MEPVSTFWGVEGAGHRGYLPWKDGLLGFATVSKHLQGDLKACGSLPSSTSAENSALGTDSGPLEGGAPGWGCDQQDTRT